MTQTKYFRRYGASDKGIENDQKKIYAFYLRKVKSIFKGYIHDASRYYRAQDFLNILGQPNPAKKHNGGSLKSLRRQVWLRFHLDHKSYG